MLQKLLLQPSILSFPHRFLLTWRLHIPTLTSLRIFRILEPSTHSHSETPNCFDGVGAGVRSQEMGNQMEGNATGKS
jgi:hypothetical protein